ncbi:MAG: hypothetical protein ACI4DQ_02005 [Lachnospiraceae bacterium]
MRQKRRFAAAIIAAALSAAWLTGCTGSRQADGTAIQATEDDRLEETAGLQNADGSPEEQKMQDKAEETEKGEEDRSGEKGAGVTAKISYGVPLSEIGEKIEYVYFRGSRVKPISDDYGELGTLLEEEKNSVLVYLLEGNKILFLPEDKANTVMELEENSCPAYYSKKEKGYLFFRLQDWWMEERGVPVTTPVSSTITLCEVGKEEGQKLYSLQDLQFIGKTDVVFSRQSEKSLGNIELSENEYIKVVMDYISQRLKESGYYGEYQLYVNRLERMPCDYTGYSDVMLDAAVIGNGIREYVFFAIYDHDDIEGVYSIYEKEYDDSPGVLSDYPEEDQKLIDNILKNNLGAVTFRVTEEGTGRDEDSVPKSRMVEKEDIRDLPVYKLADRISHAYSYAEWFGLNELDYRAGEVRQFYGKEVAMYCWHTNGDILYFIPLDKANHFIIDKEGNKCPVYVDKDGDMEFFSIEAAHYQNNPGQLSTTLISYEYIPLEYGDGLLWLGQEEIPLKPLEEMGLEPITEDGFTRGLKKEIERMLTEAGKNGTYEIYLGEYSISDSNKVCISAAVTGEEEAWYFRFLMVRYGENDYCFWPIGFGLNGNLEECEAGSHRMNAVCIERMVRLKRYQGMLRAGEEQINIL